MSLPTSRAQAKAEGSIHYLTGKPCKNGHFAPRLTSYCACIECAVMFSHLRYTTKREEVREYQLKYRAANLDRYKEYQREYHKEYGEANRERLQAYQREYAARKRAERKQAEADNAQS